MDKSAKITYAMIEVAIEKGMRDIEDNPFCSLWLVMELPRCCF
jgi:hypothetical protein